MFSLNKCKIIPPHKVLTTNHVFMLSIDKSFSHFMYCLLLISSITLQIRLWQKDWVILRVHWGEGFKSRVIRTALFLERGLFQNMKILLVHKLPLFIYILHKWLVFSQGGSLALIFNFFPRSDGRSGLQDHLIKAAFSKMKIL